MLALVFSFITGITADRYYEPPLYQVRPYIGYHLGATDSRIKSVTETTPEESSRERYWRFGVPFNVKKYEWESVPPFYMVVLPELSLGSRIVGFTVAAGPEQRIYIGPRMTPTFLVYGLQAGFHYSVIFKEDGFLAKDEVVAETTGGTTTIISRNQRPYSAADKNTFAGVLNAYVGTQVSFGKTFALSVLGNSQFFMGRIAPNTIRTTFGDNLGWTFGINLQLDY